MENPKGCWLLKAFFISLGFGALWRAWDSQRLFSSINLEFYRGGLERKHQDQDSFQHRMDSQEQQRDASLTTPSGPFCCPSLPTLSLCATPSLSLLALGYRWPQKAITKLLSVTRWQRRSRFARAFAAWSGTDGRSARNVPNARRPEAA